MNDWNTEDPLALAKGWYAVMVSWDDGIDIVDGNMPDAWLFQNGSWVEPESLAGNPPKVVFNCGPFSSEMNARKWAESNDPDWCD